MFADIDADVSLLVDGAGTYDAAAAPLMLRRLLDEQLDMVVAARRSVHADAYRAGHGMGNRLFNRLYRPISGPGFRDIFSGYRALSRRFVKSFPAISHGFEIKTEMSVHATAILATGLMVLAGIALTCGLILDSVARGRLEQKRFAYLAQSGDRAAR